jgi:hypothetical protein
METEVKNDYFQYHFFTPTEIILYVHKYHKCAISYINTQVKYMYSVTF